MHNVLAIFGHGQFATQSFCRTVCPLRVRFANLHSKWFTATLPICPCCEFLDAPLLWPKNVLPLGFRIPNGIVAAFLAFSLDGHDISNGASIKGWVVWTLATGSSLLVSTDVTFDEQVFPRLLGPIEWEISEARGGKTTLKPSALHKESQGLDVLPFEVTAEEINM